MECYKRYIITMTSKARQGKRPRNIRTLRSRQVSKIKKQTRAVACSSSLRRHDPVRKLSRHSVYGQVGRRKLRHNPLRHGRFTIIVKRVFIAFIKQNNGMLYKPYPLLAVQYKIQRLSYIFCSVLWGKYLKKSLKFIDLGLDIIGRSRRWKR